MVSLLIFWLILYGQLEAKLCIIYGSYDIYFLEWEKTNGQFLRLFLLFGYAVFFTPGRAIFLVEIRWWGAAKEAFVREAGLGGRCFCKPWYEGCIANKQLNQRWPCILNYKVEYWFENLILFYHYYSLLWLICRWKKIMHSLGCPKCWFYNQYQDLLGHPKWCRIFSINCIIIVMFL